MKRQTVDNCTVAWLFTEYVAWGILKCQCKTWGFRATSYSVNSQAVIMILCCLMKLDVWETKGKGLPSTIPHISKNDRLFCCSQRLKSIANNRIWCQLDDKAVHCFQILTLAFSKYCFKHFYKNLFFTFRARNHPRKGTENAYTIYWFRCTAELLRK